MLVELTEEELKAFKTIYEDNALYEYLDYDEEDNLLQTAFATLLTKLCINLTGEQDV